MAEWVKGKPQTPGFYFYRDELFHPFTVIEAIDAPPGLFYDALGREEQLDDYPEGEHWSEPIEGPPDISTTNIGGKRT